MDSQLYSTTLGLQWTCTMSGWDIMWFWTAVVCFPIHAVYLLLQKCLKDNITV